MAEMMDVIHNFFIFENCLVRKITVSVFTAEYNYMHASKYKHISETTCLHLTKIVLMWYFVIYAAIFSKCITKLNKFWYKV